MLLNMDSFGLRHASKDDGKSRQQYLTADLNRSLHIHQTSLNLANDSKLTGGSQGKFLAVAEGVGEDDAASRASTLAIDCVSRSLVNERGVAIANETSEREIEKHLVALVHASQDEMLREGRVIENHRGMAARLGIGYVRWPNLYVVQVGATRCVLLRNGWLTEWSAPLDEDTDDHFVGGEKIAINPFVCRVPLRLGDRLLMSCGPIGDAVEDFELKQIMGRSQSASKISESLLAAAVKNGSADGSLVVSCFDEGSAGPTQQNSAPLPVSVSANMPPKNDRPDQAISGKVDDVEKRWAKRRAEPALSD